MIAKVSTRHHYIPVFYAKGFANDTGFLYVYDKQEDRIKKGMRSPKSIFFEDDRNTMTFGTETSILEDKYFKELDDKCKVGVGNLRDKPNSEELLNTDNTTDIDVFVLNLFWRIPKTDYTFEKYISEGEIVFTDKEGNLVRDEFEEQRLKNDSNFKKFQRTFLPFKFLRAYLDTREKKSRGYVQLFEKTEKCFLVGDYPMVFSKTPGTGDDLFEIDYYLPISSNRLFYASRKERELRFDFDKVVRLNALIINQSHRYVCGPDLEYLRKSVDYYKHLKLKGLMLIVHNKVFGEE